MILAILAHPDDETFACGGLLAGHALNGEAVRVLVLSDGVSSRDPNASPRWLEYHAACAALGVQSASVCAFADQRADEGPRLVLAKLVSNEIAAVAPTLVYTHFTGDLNVDHRRVAEAVLVATRGLCPVRCVSPEWPNRALWPWSPTHTYTMTVAVQERRYQAATRYASELHEWPHPRSLERMRRESVERYLEIPQWS